LLLRRLIQRFVNSAETCLHRSGFTGQLAAEPRPGEPPLAVDGGSGDSQYVGRLLQGKPAKVTQFHDTTLSRVEFRQVVQQVVQRNSMYVCVRAEQCGRFEFHPSPTAGPFGHLSSSRVINEDPAHHLRGQREKLCPVFPRHVSLVDKSKIRFVDERGRLQRVARPLASEVGASPPAQILIHQRNEAITCGLIPLPQA